VSTLGGHFLLCPLRAAAADELAALSALEPDSTSKSWE